MDSLKLLKGKVVIVTGASSGIGAGAAVVLAKHGCRLALHGRNQHNLSKTQAECLDAGLGPDEVVIVTGCVQDTEDCQRLVDETVKAFGRLDVLVNNAGLAIRGTAASLDVDEFDRQLNVNVRSVFQLSKFALPHLEKTRGNIINISSIAGIRPVVNSLAYCTSKAAVDHLTRNLALEFAAKGVRVNGISPGVIVSEFQKRAGMPEDVYDKFLVSMAESYPLKRVGYPEDVAKAIIFLASDMSSFVTGSSILVDGGSHLGGMGSLPTPSSAPAQSKTTAKGK